MLTTCAFIAADAHAQTNQDLAELQDLAAIEKRITELQSLLTAKRLDIDKSNIVTYTIYRRQDRLVDIVRRLNGLETDLVESEKPVYLDDDRTNYYDANAHQKAAAQSVAVVVRDVDLIDVDEHHYTLPQQRLGLCVGERFRNEPAPGKCSAFKIGPDLVATAGHCVADDNNDSIPTSMQ